MGVCSFVMSNPGDCSLPYLEKRFYSAYLHQHLLHFPSCSASSLPARQLRPPALRGARQRISLSALVFLLTHHGDRSLSSPENALHCFSHQHPLHAALLIAFNTCVLALLIVLDIYALTPLYVNALVLMHMAILSVSPSLVTTHFFLSSILRAAPALAVLSARARAASAPLAAPLHRARLLIGNRAGSCTSSPRSSSALLAMLAVFSARARAASAPLAAPLHRARLLIGNRAGSSLQPFVLALIAASAGVSALQLFVLALTAASVRRRLCALQLFVLAPNAASAGLSAHSSPSCSRPTPPLPASPRTPARACQRRLRRRLLNFFIPPTPPFNCECLHALLHLLAASPSSSSPAPHRRHLVHALPLPLQPGQPPFVLYSLFDFGFIFSYFFSSTTSPSLLRSTTSTSTSTSSTSATSTTSSHLLCTFSFFSCYIFLGFRHFHSSPHVASWGGDSI
jgi:hypothetical protein